MILGLQTQSSGLRKVQDVTKMPTMKQKRRSSAKAAELSEQLCSGFNLDELKRLHKELAKDATPTRKQEVADLLAELILGSTAELFETLEIGRAHV